MLWDFPTPEAAVDIDQLVLKFDPKNLLVLNVILGLIMFGVALDLRVADFRRAVKNPRGPTIGLLCQFLLLPALTFLLARLVAPTPSVALGMILVASCPGGNMSNFITHMARGRTELSVTMTAISTVAAIVMTPLNLKFWASMDPGTNALLQQVELNPLSLLGTVATLLGVPVVVGMLLAAKAPGLAAKLRKPFKIASLLFFGVFICVAFAANLKNFVMCIGIVFFPVLIHNAFALALGYVTARLSRLPEADARAVSVEVGIQNAGLGMILIFDFFDGLGGMAVIAAWWGIWHIIAGLGVARLWTLRDASRANPDAPAPDAEPAAA